ncbi:MotA/TolQ/ExbB proton channel [Anaeromyxobacter dehalogenans 2CP-1]|uniref:MotA/TolQ/ExbB proton channel n=1 Tax=Anaeromyxobacter dehalogenans (strain ATCC BAA-258 / DSM 21875 / 2CP-1) TaxID=455488 RepID=B8J595_ANAD2|nr:MotA/TolQ/ExbB proton channel family protein [Anaeromyxobacter dehalogenans]ACL64950.1 MotA/TolQ/ExbB proton channel [Anaeromyxobacter dehalogenans 2CP-1]
MTNALFHLFTRAGAEWVMFLLAALSVASVTLILERLAWFARRRAPVPGLLPLLRAGRLEEARLRVGQLRGLEAEVARAAIDAAEGGPASVHEAVACAIAEARPGYERALSFLGTLGNNAPFLGLFGTVIGVIQAFSDLAVGGPRGAGAAAVMAGISEALVATAAGILVAIPAVVAFNGYQRWLKALVQRAEAIEHALAAHLERDEVRQAALARARPPVTAA